MRYPPRRPFHDLTSELLAIASNRAREPDVRQKPQCVERIGNQIGPDEPPTDEETILKTTSFALLVVLSVLAIGSLLAEPAAAFNSQRGMPREPRTFRGHCAKVSEGVHIPYRGWHTRNRLAFNRCLRGVG